MTVRRRRITAGHAKGFLTQLATLNFIVDPPPQVTDLPRLQALADSRELTAYDVAYLELAKRLALPLPPGIATSSERPRRKASWF